MSPARYAHIKALAEENNVRLADALALADLLGPNEDYDGLVTALQDYDGWDEE